MGALGDAGDLWLIRVVKFSEGRIVLADQCEGGNLKDWDDLFKYLTASPGRLQQLKGHCAPVSPSGWVRDPGSIP
jgi:CRISPR-associated endonuclease Csn1